MKTAPRIISIFLSFIFPSYGMEADSLLKKPLTKRQKSDFVIDIDILGMGIKRGFNDDDNLILDHPANPYVDISKSKLQELVAIAKGDRTIDLEKEKNLVSLFCTAHYLQVNNIPLVSWAEKIKSSDLYKKNDIVSMCVEDILCNISKLAPKNIRFINGVLTIENAPLTSLYNFNQNISRFAIDSAQITEIQIKKVPLSIINPPEMQSILQLPLLKKLVLKNTQIVKLSQHTFQKPSNGMKISLKNNNKLIESERGTFERWINGQLVIVSKSLKESAVQNIYKDLEISDEPDDDSGHCVGPCGGFLGAIILNSIVLPIYFDRLNDHPALYSLIPASVFLFGCIWIIAKKIRDEDKGEDKNEGLNARFIGNRDKRFTYKMIEPNYTIKLTH